MKRSISFLLSFFLIFVLAVPAFAAEEGVPHVVDNAGLLTAEEQKALDRKALALSKKWKFDFVILTVKGIGSADIVAYADDFFDYNGYGYGENFDGILLMLDMGLDKGAGEGNRDWCISTCGYGITAFTDYGQEHMMKKVVPKLRDGDYNAAFETFLDQGEQLLRQAKNGKPLDVPKHFAKFPFISLIVSMIVGFVLAMMPVEDMKKQVKNVASQKTAKNYVQGNGLELSHQSDRFLYSHVSRRVKPKESSSSSSSSHRGGSTTHTSSSGRTHGGSRGKF